MGPDNAPVQLPDSISPDFDMEPEQEFRNYKEERKHRSFNWRDPKAPTLHYQRLPVCGHKFIPETEPRHRNCTSCWFTFFSAHEEFTKSCNEVMVKVGPQALIQLRGPKLFKHFVKYMSARQMWEQATTKESEETASQ